MVGGIGVTEGEEGALLRGLAAAVRPPTVSDVGCAVWTIPDFIVARRKFGMCHGWVGLTDYVHIAM